MANRRSFLQGIGTLALARGLSGCAPAESALRVFLLEGSIPPRLIQDFQKTIEDRNLKFQSETKLQNLLKLLEAWRQRSIPTPASSFPVALPFTGKSSSPRANLVTLGDAWLASAIRERLIEPIEPARLTNWSKLPPRWRSLVTRDEQGFPNETGKIWGAPYRWGSTVIVYNEDKFKRFDWRPEDWSDLWREELTGRIALVDNPREVIGLTLKKLGGSYNPTDLDRVPDLTSNLLSLQKQVKFYSSSYYLQPLLVGDVWLSVGWSDDILPVTEQYREMKLVVPRSGTSLWSDVWVQPAMMANDPLADRWIDFCWKTNSVDRISLFTDGLSPMVIDRPAGELPVDIRKDPLLADRPALEKSEFLLPLAPKVEKEIDRLWEKMRRST
ncbi:extracellular solute-binding protein [Pannus brasiliensis CCIBt3594]|uniref:Extracellular solute-binding protein n=1 Tax=Pannus brasiliensis CCIBt3594 TaxID=1427578 RepID=A0AAW9QZH6_9CHRO